MICRTSFGRAQTGERVERERGQQEEEEEEEEEDKDHEASLTEAIADRTEALKLVVDKWFVDQALEEPRQARGSERERGQQEEEEEEEDKDHEASLTEAIADRTEAVKLVVHKWFVVKGFGFGKIPTGEVR